MLAPLQHPVLGSLAPDQWNLGLLKFRQFPHWKLFWPADSAEALARLDAKERQWVVNCQQHGTELARVCRNAHVHRALQSLGVYEVSLRVGKNGEPTPAHVATYQWFCDHEESICRNVQDALLRYYRHARATTPDWFVNDDYPDATTIEELAPWVTFDGFGIGRRASQGLCPITFGWNPAWDPEHGLQMTLYRDQVLEIGQAGESLLLQSPELYAAASFLMWGPEQLNEAERKVLEEFLAGYVGG